MYMHADTLLYCMLHCSSRCILHEIGVYTPLVNLFTVDKQLLPQAGAVLQSHALMFLDKGSTLYVCDSITRVHPAS